MSVRCQVTGKKPSYGTQVSHSHRRSKRRWVPNVQRRTFWLPSEGRRVRLRVSAKGLKTIDKRGIEAVIAELRVRGERI